MAKIKKGLLDISGKVGDVVVTKSVRYGTYIRKTVKPGTKKEEAGLKSQYSRTAFLNRLASEINGAMLDIAGILKPGTFYARLLSLFRKEPLDKRLLLLHCLKGMELRPEMPFTAFCNPGIRVSPSARSLKVMLEVTDVPQRRRGRHFDCYSFEISSLVWMPDDGDLLCSTEKSEWVSVKDTPPAFQFSFPVPKGAVHWMVMLRIRLGLQDAAIESFSADALQIRDAGSFSKAEQNWLESLLSERKDALVTPLRQVKHSKRVKRIR